MVTLNVLFLFLIGLSVGSFINVVVYRLNRGLSPFSGRSFCDHCRKKLFWFDNIPLLSFVLLKGKCRFCHSPIPYHYPLVELACGLMTPFVFYFSPFYPAQTAGGIFVPDEKIKILSAMVQLFIAYCLMIVFVSDWLYSTIPDHAVYLGIFLTFILLLIRYSFVPPANVLSGLVSAGFFAGLVCLTRGKGMGIGDVKLAGLMGLLLGYPAILPAMAVAFVGGAFVGSFLVLASRKTFKSQISFGPFLVAATWAVALAGEKLAGLFLW